MSGPKRFQVATIEAAMHAFRRGKRVRRFLVADEVGLGKTIVARGVLRQLVERKRRRREGPLRVFYVCSSLAIAGQNRTSLLKALDDVADRNLATCDVDRLTLIPNLVLPPEAPLHLLTLTPDTSLPDRRGKRRDGKAEERALLHNLIRHRYPGLQNTRGNKPWLRRQAKKSWGGWKKHPRTQPRAGLADAFFSVLRRQLGLSKGQHLPGALRRRVERDPLDAIQQLRISLARAGLKQLAPDLVIFDEFQRFSDLLHGDGRGSDIAREMVGSGPRGPAVLLLSATPFRLYGGEMETAFDGQPHHKQFFALVEWLLGKDTRAARERQELEALFSQYASGLRSADPLGDQTMDAKRAIETSLRRVIARTERFGHDQGRDVAHLVELDAPLSSTDLSAYRHLVRCFRPNDDAPPSGHVVSAAIRYWTSAPLAMQTLGKRYKPWKEARRLPTSQSGLFLRSQESEAFGGPAQWAHPQLRALRAELPPERLAVPWTAPSLPWWPLGEPWLSKAPAKTLLFSRFRATPRSIAALLSYDLERSLLKGGDTGFAAVTTKTLLGPSRKNLTFFHPSPILAEFFDPALAGASSPAEVHSASTNAVRQGLQGLGVVLTGEDGPPRSFPELVVALERRAGCWDHSLKAWRTLGADLARSKSEGKKTLRQVVDDWDASSLSPLQAVSQAELARLAKAAASGAGVVVGRSLARHGLALDSAASIRLALGACWEGLRSYLNNPWMDASLRDNRADPRGYRQRIADAILIGNLESVLDEHLWVTSVLRGCGAAELAKTLKMALSLRTSNVLFHGLGDDSSFRLRAHAALPFTAEVRQHRPEAEERSASARQDELRVAFNSPFWPHLLASTSVGQEGLDFHAWCARVAHWDLPGNPVDLEQREGRVDRYAGLSSRRALAGHLGFEKPIPRGSPWSNLAGRAEVAHADDPAGLAPWWICQGARIERLVFDVPLSEARQKLERLKTQRLLYRLALGQPDQEDLVHALHGRVGAEDAVRATLVLSPWRADDTCAPGESLSDSLTK